MALAYRDAASQGLSLPPGAEDRELSDFEKRFALTLPDELKSWLRVCNGPRVGAGGFFGIRTGDYGDGRAFSIDECLEFHPDWIESRWIPVASDGCGNTYVLDGRDRKRCPAFFVETCIDSKTPRYWVASSVLHLFEFLLLEELEEHRWPFQNPSWVLSKDQDIVTLGRGIPLPWET